MVSTVVVRSRPVYSRLESPKKDTKTFTKKVLLLLLILLVYDAALGAQAPSGRGSHRCDYDHECDISSLYSFTVQLM